MDQVLMEVQRGDGTWRRVGSVSEVEPPGSISADAPHRRVLMFGWYQDRPGVWESRGGIDASTELARMITTTALDLLSDLAEPYYVETYHRGLRMQLRFTLTRGMRE